MWELDIKKRKKRLNAEELMLSNCGVGENSWESPGKQKDQMNHFKGNQTWIVFGRTDAEAEAPICWLHDANIPLIGKDPDAEKIWRQKEKRATEGEMVRWHHRLNGC